MGKDNRKFTVAAVTAGLLLAAAPWCIPLAAGMSAASAIAASVCSLLALVLTALLLIVLRRRRRSRASAVALRCRQIYEPLARMADMPEQPEPETEEAWLDALEQAGEALRGRLMRQKRGEQGFIVQWTQRMQKLCEGIDSVSDGLRGREDAAATALGRECVAIRSLSEQLLQYFECAQGNIVCNRKKTDLSRVVSDAIVRNSAGFNSKRIGLRRTVSRLYSVTDPTVLAAVLDQLLDNALRYTDEGGVIGVSCRDAGDTVRLSVEDAGRGIPSDELPHIFDRGYICRCEQPGSPGMGLFMVRSYLELLGHGLEVRSEEGKGTQVVLILKKEPDEPAAQPET